MLQSGFAAASVGYPLHSQHVSQPNVLQCMHVQRKQFHFIALINPMRTLALGTFIVTGAD